MPQREPVLPEIGLRGITHVHMESVPYTTKGEPTRHSRGSSGEPFHGPDVDVRDLAGRIDP